MATEQCVTGHTTTSGPPTGPGVVRGPAAERARRLLAGYGPARLLSEVSVARVAGTVADSVRDPIRWLRPLMAGLDAFRQICPDDDLGSALTAAWAEPWRADRSLAEFAVRLDGAGPPELSRLGLGPKLWYTVNGVPAGWRPLPAGGSATLAPTPTRLCRSDADRLVAAARVLVGAGLGVDELAGLRLGDLGRLVPGEVFVPDLLADPLAVRLRPRARGVGRPAPWLVLLGYEARIAVVAAVLGRHGPDAACRHSSEPLLGADDELRARVIVLTDVETGPAVGLA